MRKRQANWPLRLGIILAVVVVIAAVWVNTGGKERVIQVCNTDPFSPHYGTIITVRESEAVHYGPISDPACAAR
ncbi:hypothetical protein EYC58_04195 [Candidatus Saccharibacteria bacterium]|nr:MAG: hypothetical protein EYC58_04195 [Candidatus Saccharibacteria bacterium]